MGAMPSAFIFQEKMDDLMRGLPNVLTYLDDILCVTKGTYEQHITELEQVLQRLSNAGLKCNLPKCTFAQKQFEYLGYNVSTEGIQPITKKVHAIQRLKRPQTLRQLSSFLGMINYYRDMWAKRSHMLSPLTDLIKGNKKRKQLVWMDTHNTAFNNIKKELSKNTL